MGSKNGIQILGIKTGYILKSVLEKLLCILYEFEIHIKINSFFHLCIQGLDQNYSILFFKK